MIQWFFFFPQALAVCSFNWHFRNSVLLAQEPGPLRLPAPPTVHKNIQEQTATLGR